MKKTIGVVTGSRADYSTYLPVLRAIAAESALDLRLYVTGMHLSARFGTTVNEIASDGFPMAQRIETLTSGDEPHDVAGSIAAGVSGFAQAFAASPPDILLVLGDRYEMLAAIIAALPFNIAIAHIAGGEITEGAMDDAIRHAITKMSHLHFVSTEAYRQRVLQMGEEPWRVCATGNPSLDNLRALKFISRHDLEAVTGIALEPAPVVVTFHPTTLEFEKAGEQVAELVAALWVVKNPLVITATNADTHGGKIRAALEEFAHSRRDVALVPNLGMQRYFSLLKIAACMVGNSSSGITEAAGFELPVVNIGDRQKGRIAGKNVIHVACERGAIESAIARALDPALRAGLEGLQNLYGDGHAAERIVQQLKSAPPREKLLWKKFQDHPSARATRES